MSKRDPHETFFRPPEHQVHQLGLIAGGVLWIMGCLWINYQPLFGLLIGGMMILGGLAEWMPRRQIQIAGVLRLLSTACFICLVVYSMWAAIQWLSKIVPDFASS
jgi:hypothetical protein